VDSIKHTFRIQYVDNNYQLVEWTEDQLSLVANDMNECEEVTLIDKCIFRLKDIRAITYLPLVPDHEQPSEEEENNGIVVTEMGKYDRELYDLLQVNGIDLGVVLKEGGTD
jgi:hypothetical protein